MLTLRSLVALAITAASASAFAVFLFGSTASAQILFAPARTSHPMPSIGTDSIGTADVDGDGLLDLVRAVGIGTRWHEGDGTGAFATTGTLIPGVSGNKLCVVDLNGDGRRDLLAVTPATATLQVALADGASGFDPPVEYPTPVPPFGLEIRSGDADADGDADVLVLAPALVAAAPGEAWLMLNDGAGSLTRGPIVAGDATHVVADGVVASVDGDSEPDLILVTTSIGQPAETAVWQGQPGGGVAVSFRVLGHEASRAVDLDVDGDIDLVAWTAQPNPSNTVTTFLGDGRGGFVAGTVHLLGTQSEDMELADFDDDGLPDLVLVLSLDNSAWWLGGDGRGGFSGPQARVTLKNLDLSTTRFVALDDFDVDGRPDVMFDEFFNPEVIVTLNQTYPAGGPLLDLGHQLQHSTGWPIQIASGSFVGGEPFAFDLFRVAVFKPVFVVVGFSVLEAPFKGGTMVPTPQIVVGPMPSGGSAELHLIGHWPPGMPSGSTIAVQFWFSASGTIAGYAASSGVLITTP